MNLQLVDAIVQISQTLSPEEQQLLIFQLNKSLVKQAVTAKQTQDQVHISKEQGWEIWRSLKTLARPSGKTDIAEAHDRYLYAKP
jgi:hypothetical protein